MCRRTVGGSAVCLSIDSRADASSCIGQISLVPKTAPSAWNIAFWLDPGYWGRGLATETVSRAVRAAFENLHCSAIHAGVAHWNSASIRIIERLAFRYTGENPAGYFVAGAPEAIHEYALTRESWQTDPIHA
jgi:ribosomal-protein-alanine N-acetyltransferase